TAGAGTIIVTGLSADRHKLALARDLGADHTIDVEREEVVARVHELTAGQLADVVVDVSAFATQPVVDALEIVRPGGTVVLAGRRPARPFPTYSTVLPPSITCTVPVMKDDSSLARNSASRATSSGSPTRRKGVRSRLARRRSGCRSRVICVIGVSIAPGAIAFTRTPSGP